MAESDEVLNNAEQVESEVPPGEQPSARQAPKHPEEGQTASGSKRRTDRAKKFQNSLNQAFETFVAPLIMEESVLHPEGREINPSRLYMLIGGCGLGVLGVAAISFLSIPRAKPDTTLALRQQPAMPSGQLQSQPLRPTGPAQPQLPVQPIPPLPPRPQQQVMQPRPPIQPRPTMGQVVGQRSVLQAGISRTTATTQVMSGEQRHQKAKAEAMARVQLRSGNLGPLNGSSRSGPATLISDPASTYSQLPPPEALPQLQSLRTGNLPRPLTLPSPIGLNAPRSLYRPAGYLAARPGGALRIAQNSGQYPVTTSPYAAQGQWQGQTGGGYPASQNPYPAQQGAYPASQNPYAFQQGSVPQLSGGLQQTQTWGLVPPGNMIRAVTRSNIQVVKSGGSINTPVFAQVRGAIRVDGQEVIPDGAILNGRVVNVDEALGRIRIEFTSLTVGTASLPLSGAMAWTVTGDSPETASISEGLLADAAGMPNYLFTDARSAVGQGASSVARTLGQTTTSSIGAFGGSSVSSYNGDLSTSLQRAAAQGLGTFFNRQAGRADAATNKIEGRGPIWTVAPEREFIVFLTQGI